MSTIERWRPGPTTTANPLPNRIATSTCSQLALVGALGTRLVLEVQTLDIAEVDGESVRVAAQSAVDWRMAQVKFPVAIYLRPRTGAHSCCCQGTGPQRKDHRPHKLSVRLCGVGPRVCLLAGWLLAG